MQQNIPQQPTQTTENSQDLVYDLVKERVVGQLDQTNGLDSKANNIIVAASAILAATLVLEGAILTLQIHAFSLNFAYTVPVLAALLIVSGATILAAIWGGFWVRSFQQIPEPKPFVEQYLSEPPTKTKKEVIDTQILVFQENNKIIDSKALAINIASIGLCLEVVGLIALLLIQIL